jgi:ABC-type lipoprotein release transport system permease subunit
MVFFPVIRNIARNKKNSAIIALLVAVITFIFFIGNSVISKSDIGIYQAYVQSLTGDVVLQKKGDITMNLFGANTPIIDDYFTIPVLPAYDAVMEIVKAQEGIAGITSQVSGRAYLDMLSFRGPVILCGADTRNYFSMFPGITLEEGRFLQSGEYGAMITADRAKRIEARSGQYPQPGTPMLFTSGGDLGFKIREVPLVGIFSYQNPGQFMNEVIIADPQTVRVLNSIQVATSDNVKLSEEEVMFLDTGIDDIFNMDFGQTPDTAEAEFSVDFLHTRLAETPDDENAGVTGGDWNFIILRLEDQKSSRSFISSLNEKIEGFGVIAVDWRVAAGTSAILLLMIQALFNAGMFLVCIAGVITTINILLISVFRRTREIGTLRAIGASDAYISSLILWENMVLTAVAGAAGIAGGFLFMKWVNSLAFNINNELIASILGGRVLALDFIPQIACLSFVLAVALGLVVSIYPIHITVRIEPVEAVRQG